MSLTIHPNRRLFRVVCSSGFILGRPVPLPPIEKYIPVKAVDAARKERYRQGCLRAWEKRRVRV